MFKNNATRQKAECAAYSMIFTMATGLIGAQLWLTTSQSDNIAVKMIEANIGLLSGAFMGGVVAGAVAMTSNASGGKKIATIGGAMAVALPLMFSGAAGRLPIGPDSPLLAELRQTVSQGTEEQFMEYSGDRAKEYAEQYKPAM